MLRIGFVGGGFAARFHLRAFTYVPDTRVVAAYSPSGANSIAKYAEAIGYPAIKGYSDLGEMLAKEDLDALWVLAPNYARVDVTRTIVEEVLQGGCRVGAVAYEKPLARNLEEAKTIYELVVKRAGLLHGYLENQVFAPSLVRGRELAWMRGAALTGRPYLARTAEEHGGPHTQWFWNPLLAGGGVLLDMGCHSVEAGRHLLSSPGGVDVKPREVYAYTATLKWAKGKYADRLKKNMGVDYSVTPAEDYARTTVTYESEDGQTALAESSNAWSFAGPGLRLTFELFGPEYYMASNTLQPELFVFFSREVKGPAGEDLVEKQAAEQGLMPAIPDESVTYGYVEENRQIAKAFAENRPARENLDDALLVMEVLMAAYKSSETQRPVKLPDPTLSDYRPAPYRLALNKAGSQPS